MHKEEARVGADAGAGVADRAHSLLPIPSRFIRLDAQAGGGGGPETQCIVSFV